MKVPSLMAVSLLLLAPLASSGKTTPKLPCKTPQELMGAVKSALESQDTNTFWKLHCWTNVSLEDGRWIRKPAYGLFKTSDDEKILYKSFSVRGVEKGYNAPRPVGPKGSLQYNIPVTGIITFTSKVTSPPLSEGNPPMKASL